MRLTTVFGMTLLIAPFSASLEASDTNQIVTDQEIVKTACPDPKDVGDDWTWHIEEAPTSCLEVYYLYSGERGRAVFVVSLSVVSSSERAITGMKRRKEYTEKSGVTPANEEPDLGDYAFRIHEDHERFFMARGRVIVSALNMTGKVRNPNSPELARDLCRAYIQKIDSVLQGTR